MALSNAEKVKRYRDRQKALREASRLRPKADAAVSPKGFGEFLAGRELMLLENLDFVGVTVRGDLTAEINPVDRPEEWEVEINSLNRATAMVGAFIDAAKELSEAINVYKRQQLDRRLAHTNDKAEVGRLAIVKERLSRKTSHFFPVIDVKGEG